MFNNLAHITDTTHSENSNILHWISTQPAILVGLVIFITYILALTKRYYASKKEQKEQDI